MSNILFRCSSLGHIMTESKPKGGLSVGCKTHLIDVYVSNKYNRHTEINGAMLDKGNETEESSITIVSRITKEFYKKNEQHLKNDFIKGTPDLFKGESISKAEIIRDTKSSWDVFTFNRAISKELDDKYYWQVMGYIALTGASKAYVDYCLNNTPYHLVEGELRKESYRHEGNDTPAWIELQLIANHVYDKATFDLYISSRGIAISGEREKAIYHGFVEIPLKERHYAFEVPRSDEAIQAIYDKVKVCREYMNTNLFKL